ncbi:MAG: serine/threonine-protein phosphatase, partial [bacterium]|nr:serine/threonine-protein phosphatase [bacterium]
VHGSVIGAGDDKPFRQEEIHLEHGDKIILYTDGVLDYPNPAGKLFGMQRFQKALQKHGHQPIQTLMDSVQMTIKDFAGSASSEDDLSMMAVEYV